MSDMALEETKLTQHVKELKEEVRQLEEQKTGLVDEMSAYAGPFKSKADAIIEQAEVKAKSIIEAAEMVKRANDAETAIRMDAEAVLQAAQAALKTGQAALERDRAELQDHQENYAKLHTTEQDALKAAQTELSEAAQVMRQRESNVTEREIAAAQKDIDQKGMADRIISAEAVLDQKKQADADFSAELTKKMQDMEELVQNYKVLVTKLDERERVLAAQREDLVSREQAAGEKEDTLTLREKAVKDRTTLLDAQENANTEQAASNADTLRLIAVKNSDLDNKITILTTLREKGKE